MKTLLSLFTRENLEKIEHTTTLCIYYILPAIVITTLIVAITKQENIGFSRQAGRGELGWNTLAILMFISPIVPLSRHYLHTTSITITQVITTIANLPQTIRETPITIQTIKTNLIPFLMNCLYSISVYLMKFRRQLGILAFWLTLTHILLWQIFRVKQGMPILFNIGETETLTGLFTILALLIGACTANNRAENKLGPNRKYVQMASYGALFFGAIHTGNIFRLIVYAFLKYQDFKYRQQLPRWKQKREFLKEKVEEFRNK